MYTMYTPLRYIQSTPTLPSRLTGPQSYKDPTPYTPIEIHPIYTHPALKAHLTTLNTKIQHPIFHWDTSNLHPPCPQGSLDHTHTKILHTIPHWDTPTTHPPSSQGSLDHPQTKILHPILHWDTPTPHPPNPQGSLDHPHTKILHPIPHWDTPTLHPPCPQGSLAPYHAYADKHYTHPVLSSTSHTYPTPTLPSGFSSLFGYILSTI